jgi:hypothetical protein
MLESGDLTQKMTVQSFDPLHGFFVPNKEIVAYGRRWHLAKAQCASYNIRPIGQESFCENCSSQTVPAGLVCT